MCGICGVIDWSDAPEADAIVRRMTPTMRHRGPDDQGISDFEFRNSNLKGSVSIGMTRLSIIDIEGGQQPVFNEDGTVGAVLNGEIYNFRELRSELSSLGHVFKTRSDSEVVAHAYSEWGPECVTRLHGMFAIAVYDRRVSTRADAGNGARGPSSEGILFLARDRLGIKPLYYAAISSQQSAVSKVERSNVEFRIADLERHHHRDAENTEGAQRSGPTQRQTTAGNNSDPGHEIRTPNSEIGNSFVFASEVRTLLASGIVPKRLSPVALESYLFFGSLVEPMTLVEGVLSLPPGHTLSIDLDKPQAIEPKAYWNVGERIEANSTNGDGQRDANAATLPRVRSLLEESVRSHLIADVPVGVFLSGGIDSTALAALASREVSGIHTFTVAFAEKEFDEAAIARRTAARFGTTHQEVFVSPDDMLARVGDAVGALDQPSIDGINTYFVSASARDAGLKVTLSGLGGDEVFGGYSSFQRTPRYQQLASAGAHVPGAVRAVMNTTMSAAISAARSSGGNRFVSGDAGRKISAIFNTPGALPDPFYFGRTLFSPTQVLELMSDEKSPESSLWRQWLAASATQARALDSFAAVSCMELQSYLVNTLLRDTDSMSMAHSLEVRVPFLDHRLVEFVLSLPQETKLRRGVPKALLVAALEDLLPDEVVNQTKRGFTFPWAEWLRGPLKARVESGLSELSPALAGSLNAKQVRAVWMDYLEGKTSWSRPWSLYVLNEWVKRNL